MNIERKTVKILFSKSPFSFIDIFSFIADWLQKKPSTLFFASGNLNKWFVVWANKLLVDWYIYWKIHIVRCNARVVLVCVCKWQRSDEFYGRIHFHVTKEPFLLMLMGNNALIQTKSKKQQLKMNTKLNFQLILRIMMCMFFCHWKLRLE